MGLIFSCFLLRDVIYSFGQRDSLYGWIPEWPKGTDCKSAANCFGGSNPPPSIFIALYIWAGDRGFLLILLYIVPPMFLFYLYFYFCSCLHLYFCVHVSGTGGSFGNMRELSEADSLLLQKYGGSIGTGLPAASKYGGSIGTGLPEESGQPHGWNLMERMCLKSW